MTPQEAGLVSSRTPLSVNTVQGFAYFLNGGFSGEVSGVVIRCDGPTATFCIAVCVKSKGPDVEHEFIVSDLRFGKKKGNGDLVFMRMPEGVDTR